MPPRVAATFGMADFIAAEDTRVTLRLLNHLGLKKPMVSYYEHALHHGEAILNRIEAGENCALCSDAGMPCISDPGEQIVREAHARGIRVVPIPAASACVTALAASGQPTARFVFEGFLPVPKRDRRERLTFLQNETRTMIFYEAPHKLRGTLDDLAAAFGADRPVSLCRELTKLHEEIKKTTLGEAVAYYKENDPRGEYVLVLAGADPAAVADAAAPTLEQAVAAARALQAGGLPPAAAAKQAAAGTPFSKGEVYRQLINGFCPAGQKQILSAAQAVRSTNFIIFYLLSFIFLGVFLCVKSSSSLMSTAACGTCAGCWRTKPPMPCSIWAMVCMT